jgi:hypothetical protein
MMKYAQNLEIILLIKFSFILNFIFPRRQRQERRTKTTTSTANKEQERRTHQNNDQQNYLLHLDHIASHLSFAWAFWTNYLVIYCIVLYFAILYYTKLYYILLLLLCIVLVVTIGLDGVCEREQR